MPSLPEDLSDDELLDQLSASPDEDLRAFDVLVSRHQKRIMTNCRFLSGSPNEAEDLAQEVFVKAYFRIGRFDRRASFKTWLQRVKINHCLDFLRKKRRVEFVELDEARIDRDLAYASAPRAEERLIMADTSREIAVVLDSLPASLRVPLLLRDYDELSYREIADRLELGLSAVKMRIRRARIEFRKRFGRPIRSTNAELREG